MAEAPKLSIVLMSPELEKLHAGALMGTIAAASGMQVNFFVTMGATKMFTKEAVEKKEFQMGEVGGTIIGKNLDLYYKMLEDGKELGEIKVYACSLVMDIMGWEMKDMLDVVDDVLGVTAFFGISEGGQIMVI
ncbi:MAG: hypothetical protein COW32_02505 [Candidatus Aquicultor secundus]|uniref:Peroxiredoxin family protein n=1 Tax=Candidatus Aquicultor secundus TaxID=1973895 RepID=A0A2M7TBS3_9ACTN|nr:DsrE/DsrF/DrsH-like family protein [Candidatus Aquicultor secundus]NCO65013.1 hypothetical protein [Solirubrobacter sp.]OIO88628.1 MAG: hypothetical protein AUK32_01040 [Candidatus Aquicultor secundus]PIU28022.1 MAG: hypothetical protein COT10_00470 [Candidatus Aquicultor secundus]PIW22836.1 MAG: hypothetical protein COW32_02505 [Candidatus Aquicultor secundus]PIX51495.1 MAG: hypothetical protein COZ51_09335 [Candidatus Aquicultor secundus]